MPVCVDARAGGAGDLGVDRHPGRQDAARRPGHGPGARGAPGRAHHRSGPRPGDHQPADPVPPRRASRIPASRWASSCWSAPAAWARPRRPWRSRISCTAVSATSSPSTCPSSRRPTRSPRSRARPRDTSATARGACSPRPCVAAVFGRAAGRGREGPPRRPGALLPGLRQGPHGGRRGARDRLQERVIILTTNAGTDTLMKLCADPETMPSSEGLVKASSPSWTRSFKPAFLGRTVIIPYFPIRDEALKTIIDLKLGQGPAPHPGESRRRAVGQRRRCRRRSPAGAPRWRAAPEISTTSSPIRCCLTFRRSCSSRWWRGPSPAAYRSASVRTGPSRTTAKGALQPGPRWPRDPTNADLLEARMEAV